MGRTADGGSGAKRPGLASPAGGGGGGWGAWRRSFFLNFIFVLTCLVICKVGAPKGVSTSSRMTQ